MSGALVTWPLKWLCNQHLLSAWCLLLDQRDWHFCPLWVLLLHPYWNADAWIWAQSDNQYVIFFSGNGFVMFTGCCDLNLSRIIQLLFWICICWRFGFLNLKGIQVNAEECEIIDVTHLPQTGGADKSSCLGWHRQPLETDLLALVSLPTIVRKWRVVGLLALRMDDWTCVLAQA